MALKRIALLVIVAVAALVPATVASASASRHHHRPKLHLGRVPLQTAQLGAVGASWTLDYGSGPTSDDGVIIITSSSGGFTSSGGPGGSGGGYVLDYGDPYTGSTGLMEVKSSVEAYRSPHAAKRALRIAPIEALFSDFFLGSPFVDVSTKRVKPPRIGQERYGSMTTRSSADLNPIVMLDEQVAAGRFVLDLTVTAGSAAAAKSAAPHLLRVLHRRLQLMLQGHKLAKPPKLPPDPKSGQAPGGPDLSTLILHPTDVGQDHAVNLLQAYLPAPPSLSDFLMILSPAGTYDGLQQQIGWWPSATEATYGEAYGGGTPLGLFGLFGSFDNSAATPTPVDLSAVSDPATGYLVTQDGQSTAYVVLTHGQAGESIVATAKGTLHASDVQSLAQAAANRLDAGLGP